MRSCGSCNACCEAPSVPEISKPGFSPCRFLSGGCDGCIIYENRPAPCRTFNCAWRTSPDLPNRFRPDKCGLILAARPDQVMTVWEHGSRWDGSKLQRLLGGLPGWKVEVVGNDEGPVG